MNSLNAMTRDYTFYKCVSSADYPDCPEVLIFGAMLTWEKKGFKVQQRLTNTDADSHWRRVLDLAWLTNIFKVALES
jgi:hypothetical protein